MYDEVAGHGQNYQPVLHSLFAIKAEIDARYALQWLDGRPLEVVLAA